MRVGRNGPLNFQPFDCRVWVYGAVRLISTMRPLPVSATTMSPSPFTLTDCGSLRPEPNEHWAWAEVQAESAIARLKVCEPTVKLS